MNGNLRKIINFATNYISVKKRVEFIEWQKKENSVKLS